LVIPFWALQSAGSDGASAKPIPASDHTAQVLFQTNCGACHTLAAGGTDGVLGPNLDNLLASNATESQDTVDGNCGLVLSTILHGLGGRMPAGILVGEQAEEVANFVARNLNYVGDAPATSVGSTGSGGESGNKSSSEAPITAESTTCSTGSSSSSSSSSGGSGTSKSQSQGSSKSQPSGTSKSQSAATSKGPGGTVAISADPTGQLKFEQTNVTSKPGAVTIDFTNKSPVAHDVKIQDSSGKLLGGTDLVTGGKATANVDLAAGTYTFYCDVPGHEEAGMKGTLVVK
jgi:plastocyanin/mono/diheme cytochrome c family protein